jgi:hypothetical protein
MGRNFKLNKAAAGTGLPHFSILCAVAEINTSNAEMQLQARGGKDGFNSSRNPAYRKASVKPGDVFG